MPDPKPDDFVRIPRCDLLRVEEFLLAATRRLADTPGVETQALATEGEVVLLELAGSWARADTIIALWGPAGRPTLPPPPKSNKPPEIPEEVRT